MASSAARLISAGAAKSGNPCERFTALYCRARRVISRITDSVNCAALVERRSLVAMARSALMGFILWLRSVEFAVNACVARNDFDVFAGFSEWTRIHKLRYFAVVLPCIPLRHALFSRIVRGQCRFHTSEIFLQPGEIERAQAHVVIRIHEPSPRVSDLCAAGQPLGGFGQQLHQSVGVRSRARVGIERRFLAN